MDFKGKENAMVFMILRTAKLEEGTFGVIHCAGVPFALTAELPWKQNQPRISCIPSGRYICKRVKSPKFGDTFEIAEVAGRDHILFHKGNIPINDSLGCILLGEQFEPLNGKTAILQSGKAVQEFMDKTKGMDEFPLYIFG